MICSDLVGLLSDEDKLVLLNDIKKSGYYTIQDIIRYICHNHTHDDFTSIDADLVISIDLHTNYKVFITEHDIYTREQIMDKYNVASVGLTDPEILFNPQQIEVIDSDYFIFDQETTTRTPQKLLSTKVYIGKEKWKDYMVAFRFMRSMAFISNNKNLIKVNNSGEEPELKRENKNEETKHDK
jgi:hypothetical protein